MSKKQEKRALEVSYIQYALKRQMTIEKLVQELLELAEQKYFGKFSELEREFLQNLFYVLEQASEPAYKLKTGVLKERARRALWALSELLREKFWNAEELLNLYNQFEQLLDIREYKQMYKREKEK